MRRICFGVACILIALAVAAQQPVKPPAKTMSGSLGVYVFPAKNQSAETQQHDEAACYAWAKENTGFDPLAAANSGAQAGDNQPPKGAVAKGAAGGAAGGAVIGAAAGDAGKGAAVGATAGAVRGKVAAKKAERRAKQAEAQADKQQAANMDGFRKAFGACMEAKDYTVK